MILKNGWVVDEAFSLRRCDVQIENGLITAVDENLTGDTAIDMTGRYILPSFIDSHMHGAMGHKISDTNPLPLSTQSPATKPRRALRPSPSARSAANTSTCSARLTLPLPLRKRPKAPKLPPFMPKALSSTPPRKAPWMKNPSLRPIAKSWSSWFLTRFICLYILPMTPPPRCTARFLPARAKSIRISSC